MVIIQQAGGKISGTAEERMAMLHLRNSPSCRWRPWDGGRPDQGIGQGLGQGLGQGVDYNAAFAAD